MAGLMAARAACVGGFDGTSNVLAGQLLGLPVSGTAAHAYTMSFAREQDAFSHYLETYPESTTLLIDTYDTVRGAARAASLGRGVKGVRLDSGDLGALARQVRAVLDEHGLRETTIVASNDLNEYKIRDLIQGGAPIDAFGVGTELVTSRDDPTLSGVYKLVERVVDGQPVPTMKFSSSKPSYPGRKDVLRAYDAQGQILAGVLVQSGEEAPQVQGAQRLEPMLELVFDQKPLSAPPSLEAIQARTRAQVAALPASRRSLDPEGGPGQEIPLIISPQTQAQIEVCQARFKVERG
jgi:nicotinate phosphoribosyltransferase